MTRTRIQLITIKSSIYFFVKTENVLFRNKIIINDKLNQLKRKKLRVSKCNEKEISFIEFFVTKFILKFLNVRAAC